jgi:YfiH family protein
MEPFIISDTDDGLKLLHIAAWQKQFPHLEAGFSSRIGGNSEPPFDTLNCGLHVADKHDDVIINRKRLASAVDFPLDSWTYAEQVHGCDIRLMHDLDKGKGIDSRETAIQAADGFITQQSELCMAALFADCVPLYFYDPQHHAVGLSHAGWKGSVKQIAQATVTRMHDLFGSEPNEMLAAIGPSIGVCCFEVDELVMDHVWKLFGTDKDSPLSEIPLYTEKSNGKFMLNLQEMNRQIMIKAGILPSHIEVSQWCTSCRSDLFFSHRKEKGKTGRMAAWIGLR